MVTFLQRTFTSLVHAHAGRTQLIQADAASRRGLIQVLGDAWSRSRIFGYKFYDELF